MYRTLVTTARILALAGMCGAAIACAKAPADPVGDAPAQAPVEAQRHPPAPVAPPGIRLAAPFVLAIRAGAAVGDTTLEADAEAPLTGDDVLTVPERGMAVVKWPEGPRAESLGAALVLLESDNVRQLGVTQRSGTARYSIPQADADGVISLAVETSRATVRALSGPADVIVSLDPAAQADPLAAKDPAAAAAAATLWIVVIDGAVEVMADQSVASAAGSASPLQVALSAGQAIAVGPSAASAAAMPVELAGIETWYGGLVAGDGPPSVTTAAYRCQVLAPRVELREQPSATAKAVAKSVALAGGAIIDVRGRSKDGAWLQAFLSATELTGWVPAADLQCIAPPDVLSIVDPATVHNVDRAALAVKVPDVASFIQDKTEIAPGGCAKLNWDVVAGTQVTFDGQAVPGKGFKVMCPATTTSYTRSGTDEAGRPQTRRLTITVSEAVAAAAAASAGTGGGGGAAGAAPAGGDPTATPCVGPECEVTVPPPLATATRRPRPTAAPVEPTDAPAPDPTDAPPPSNPTDPPSTDPTDRPEDPTATPTPPAATDTPLPTPGASETPEPPTETPPPPSETPTPEGIPTPTP